MSFDGRAAWSRGWWFGFLVGGKGTESYKVSTSEPPTTTTTDDRPTTEHHDATTQRNGHATHHRVEHTMKDEWFRSILRE